MDYKIRTASQKEIALHLEECDINFIPKLSQRVNIVDYSKKLYDKAITFEAWEREKLCGMIAAYLNTESIKFVFITNVSVLEKYRRAGIASDLLNMCVEYAVKNSFKEIRLEVSVNNIPAINFYKKNGFTQCELKNSLVLMNRFTT